MGHTALLVVHGIGAQERGETLAKLTSGLRRVDRDSVSNDIHDGVVATIGGQSVRLYEVYWADLLKGDLARGGFQIKELQSLSWFPWFNIRRGNYQPGSYSFLKLAWWYAGDVFSYANSAGKAFRRPDTSVGQLRILLRPGIRRAEKFCRLGNDRQPSCARRRLFSWARRLRTQPGLSRHPHGGALRPSHPVRARCERTLGDLLLLIGETLVAPTVLAVILAVGAGLYVLVAPRNRASRVHWLYWVEQRTATRRGFVRL